MICSLFPPHTLHTPPPALSPRMARCTLDLTAFWVDTSLSVNLRNGPPVGRTASLSLEAIGWESRSTHKPSVRCCWGGGGACGEGPSLAHGEKEGKRVRGVVDRGPAQSCFFFYLSPPPLPLTPFHLPMDVGADDVSMDGSGGLGEEETLVEFRAGLMRVAGAQLESDPRRGLVRLQRVREKDGRGREREGGRRGVLFRSAHPRRPRIPLFLSFRASTACPASSGWSAWTGWPPWPPAPSPRSSSFCFPERRR